MANLNQFIDPELSTSDVLHSNGYGAVAGGGGAGGVSMEKRRQLLSQPRVVGAYQYSRMGRQGSSYKARTADQRTDKVYDASTDSFVEKASYASKNRQSAAIQNDKKIDRSIERRQHFVEPQSRKYDKYA